MGEGAGVGRLLYLLTLMAFYDSVSFVDYFVSKPEER